MAYQIGDIVRHFKYEISSPEQQAQNFYTYRIEGFATDCETLKQVIVYRALYGDFKLWVRPLDDFIGPVDKEKYPDIKQVLKYRKIGVKSL